MFEIWEDVTWGEIRVGDLVRWSGMYPREYLVKGRTDYPPDAEGRDVASAWNLVRSSMGMVYNPYEDCEQVRFFFYSHDLVSVLRGVDGFEESKEKLMELV